LKNEININNQLTSFLRNSEKKGVPKMIECFQENRETLLIFELLKGDITKSELSLQDLPKIIEDIARVLASLHLRGFVHFDIRPGENN
jgi:tRNA A-37 threonylcarbamoyl transferase component Bud32